MMIVDVVFPNEARCVSGIGKDLAHVHVVVFQSDIEGRQPLVSSRALFEVEVGM